MIFDYFVGMVTTTIMLFFSYLPSLPAMDSSVTSGIDTIVGYITQAVSFVSYLLTPALLTFTITVSIVLINFSLIYNTVMWVLRKIPFIAIE